MTGPPEESLKFDEGKVPYDLLSPYFLEDVAKVLQYGAEKYGPWNWIITGFRYSRLFSAIMRHLWTWWRGESLDPESNCSHLAHAACMLMFLMHEERCGTRQGGHDDRVMF